MDRQNENDGQPRGSREREYEKVLRDFGAQSRTNAECIQHLVSLGYTAGQARNALYRYRQRSSATREK